MFPESVWICCEVEVVLGGGHVVQHEIDELEIEVVAVGVESVGDLQTRGATMFVVGSICMVMRLRCSDLERGGTCIEEKVLVDQLGCDGHEAEELESVVVVQECVYVFGLHVGEVVGEQEEWRFLPAKVEEEWKEEVRKLMEPVRVVAWSEMSRSFDSFGCPRAC